MLTVSSKDLDTETFQDRLSRPHVNPGKAVPAFSFYSHTLERRPELRVHPIEVVAPKDLIGRQVL